MLILLTDSLVQLPPLGGGLWSVAWGVISYSQRKKEIGGWLFFYYVQLYVGSVLVALVLVLALLPGSWTGPPELYGAYLLATVPTAAVVIAQAIVANRLRRSRDAAYLVLLRRILRAHLVLALIKTAIDAKFFPASSLFDGVAVLWPALWLPYFYRSVRVGHVFVTKDWMRVAEFVTD